jgi:tripartite-type tricarboxylate transporter receptor subunit TctC
MHRRRALLALAATLATAGLLTSTSSVAQDYPNKPIRLIVQYAAGGGADFVARIVSQDLSQRLGQSVVVENRAGANGAIANQAAASSAPDGYTLLLGAAGPMVINPHIYGSGAVDTLKDFVPIAIAATSPFAVTLHPSVQANSLADLTALAKARPGTLNFGTSGNGGAPHLAAELYQSMAGVKLVHVPYKGLAPAINDLIAGQVQLAFADVGLVMAHVKAGKLKAVAVTSAKRSSVLPELPTIAESGLPGYQANTWYGVFAPAGTPPAIIEKLSAAIREGLALPAVKERLASQALEPVDMNAAQFASFVQSDYGKWGKVVKDAAITPN